MSNPDTTVAKLPLGRIWLRVAKPDWDDPLDGGYAKRAGGRWNPPGSFATLYLSGDILTARLQIERMCSGTPVTFEDLSDDAYVLVAATLPPVSPAADAVSDIGLVSLGLPTSYPLDERGRPVSHKTCQKIGVLLHRRARSGVWCRSASTWDGRGRELAWFSDTRRAVAVWAEPMPFGRWRRASVWGDIGLEEQADPIT